ncbi:hypothetical protein ACN47E_006322 [Coniothyrium glycines]
MDRLSSFFGSTVSNAPIVSKASSAAGLPSLSVQLPAGLAGRPTPQLAAIAGAATLGSILLLGTLSKLTTPATPKPVDSPKDTLLPTLSEDEIKDLPYPPHALPGSRDVKSPYGTIRVYEWGPKDGEKVLLIHGISTPSIALTDVAYKLVEKGCRVMLFDLFGRGYSSAPSPELHRYDTSLYTSQILLVLQSSTITWTSFTLVGYSLGGAIAADFTSYFPHLVKGLVLVAPGGLIREKHITWKSKLTYQSGWMSEWMVQRLVANRLWTGTKSGVESDPGTAEHAETTTTSRGDSDESAVYLSSNRSLLPGMPQSTVSAVVDWQIKHHKGFVPAFISTIRHGPIHKEHSRWQVIGENIDRHEGPLKEVWFVLGEDDPIVIADEITEDAKAALGEDNVKIRLVKEVGHEVAIERAEEVVKGVLNAQGRRKKRTGGARSHVSSAR